MQSQIVIGIATMVAMNAQWAEMNDAAADVMFAIETVCRYRTAADKTKTSVKNLVDWSFKVAENLTLGENAIPVAVVGVEGKATALKGSLKAGKDPYAVMEAIDRITDLESSAARHDGKQIVDLLRTNLTTIKGNRADVLNLLVQITRKFDSEWKADNSLEGADIVIVMNSYSEAGHGSKLGIRYEGTAEELNENDTSSVASKIKKVVSDCQQYAKGEWGKCECEGEPRVKRRIEKGDPPEKCKRVLDLVEPCDTNDCGDSAHGVTEQQKRDGEEDDWSGLMPGWLVIVIVIVLIVAVIVIAVMIGHYAVLELRRRRRRHHHHVMTLRQRIESQRSVAPSTMTTYMDESTGYTTTMSATTTLTTETQPPSQSTEIQSKKRDQSKTKSTTKSKTTEKTRKSEAANKKKEPK